VRIVGNHIHHDAGDFIGIDGVSVTFHADPGNGTVRGPNSEGGSETEQETTHTIGEGEGEVSGIASVEWTPPTAPGTYHITASGPTLNGPVQFTVTVPRAPLSAIDGSWFNSDQQNFNVRGLNFSVDGDQVFVFASGRCENGEEANSCGWGESISADVTRWPNRREVSFVADEGFATKTITVRYIDANQIRATTLTHFTDESGRPNYTTTETLTRSD
jgi:hypothetical protein